MQQQCQQHIVQVQVSVLSGLHPLLPAHSVNWGRQEVGIARQTSRHVLLCIPCDCATHYVRMYTCIYSASNVYRYTKNRGREFGCRFVVLFLQSQLSSSCVVGMYMYMYINAPSSLCGMCCIYVVWYGLHRTTPYNSGIRS